MASFRRPYAALLADRLFEPRRFIIAVTGSRQVGKTTLVEQVAAESDLLIRYATADEPSLKGEGWLEQQWQSARLEAREWKGGAVLVLDEIQKVPAWSETVKRLWDEDTRAERPLRVIVLGSAPLTIYQGLTESLAGRFEVLHLPHWSYPEMRDAFGWTVEQYVFYGGYPGAAPLITEPDRWARYILDSLVETTISRDVLLLTRVDKPALLRRLFELGSSFSAQVLSYTKMLGQLQDAGNTTTLAHYLELLDAAGMVTGLQKYAGNAVRQRGSSPKLQIYNTALMTAATGLTLDEARADGEFWGRLIESAVGAHLVNAAARGLCELYYWRDRNREVDFVLRQGRTVTAIEVKSGRRRVALRGIDAFGDAFGDVRKLLVGGDGIPVEQFLSLPVEHWAAP